MAIDNGGNTAVFFNQINAQIASLVGDSGSAILNKENKILGLMFSGSASGLFSLFTDINVILKALKINIFLR